MRKYLLLFRKQGILLVFFSFLIISLFLGDGKQPVVDIWWALGILFLYALHYYQHRKLELRPLPRLVLYSWIALILYYAVRTVFSDSVGYSISSTVRLIEAYLLYYFFYTISSDRLIEIFASNLVIVGVIAILASWIFIVFPSWASFLPLMNLLYASYGHNHLVDLLLPIFPLIIAQIQHKPSKLSWFLLLFYTVGMILTFARGAWILLIGYLIYVFLYSKGDKFTQYKRAILIVLFSFVFLFVGTSLFSRQFFNDAIKPTNWLIRQLIKPPLIEDGRFKYWKQAVLTIKERPWFGSGPGTFFLQSKRLQARPNSYSWFAHSFPLQVFVELGAVGAVLLLYLIYKIWLTVFWLLQRKNKSEEYLKPLAWGVFLMFIYSFYEFNLDYLVLWLLFWAGLGIIVGNKIKIDIYQRASPIIWGVLLLLIFYYVLSIASEATYAITRDTRAALLIAPYNSKRVLGYLENSQLQQRELTKELWDVIWFFHQGDPEVIYELAHIAERPENNLPPGLLYENAIRIDPLNKTYSAGYLSFLLEQSDFKELISSLRIMSIALSRPELRDRINQIDFLTTSNRESNFYNILHGLRARERPTETLSTIYYLLGLTLLDENPFSTRQLWALARDMSPEWSYFHIELAGLEKYKFHDPTGADEVLRRCLVIVSARDHCLEVMVAGLPEVGFLQESIRSTQ